MKPVRYEKPRSIGNVTTRQQPIDPGSCDSDHTFTNISISDKKRWYNQPDQKTRLENNDNSLYFEMKPYFKKSFKEEDLTGTKYRHNFECDVCVVTLRYYDEKDVFKLNTRTVGPEFNVRPYIPHSNSVNVFMNGRKLGREEFEEVDEETIRIIPRATFTDEIIIQYSQATLVDGIHFRTVNCNIVDFETNKLFTTFNITDMKAWGYRVKKESQHPIKIIDKVSKVVVKNVQHWHPVHGHHFVEPSKNIDLMADEDPAVYNNTPVENQTGTTEIPWGENRVGQIWLDTSDLHYTRYHDPYSIDCKEERLKLWGQLADFGEVKVYEWVKSNVRPEEWDKIAEDEENDLNVPEKERKSGVAVKQLFELDSNGDRIPFQNQYEVFDAAIEGELNGDQYTITTSFENFEDSRVTINAYVNGFIHLQDIIVPDSKKITLEGIKEADRIHVVRTPTTDVNLIEDLIDDDELVHEYQYVEKKLFNVADEEKPVYYFWVRNKKTISPIRDKTVPASLIERNIKLSDSPYCLFLKPLKPKMVKYKDDYVELPWRMIQTVVKGVRGIIDADRRYVVRFTRDFTLRDSLDHGSRPMELKNLHEEWQVMRQEQTYIIDRMFWDKITECIIGKKLNNRNASVPSYERQIYDVTYDTETRYGLEDGQAFTDGKLALESILDYLRDRKNNFYPTNIDVFFQDHSFDTEESIIESMDVIFSTFPFHHVNRMFFSILHDALAVKHEYPGVFKTSWIALHSIVTLDDRGMFDD